MATVTPTAQPARNRQPRDWGNYASPELLPNAVGFTTPADVLTPLEAGDTAHVANRAVWSCESAGAAGAGDATWTCELSRSQGFQTANIADYYLDPAAGTAPGADDFLVLTTFALFSDPNPGGVQIIAQSVSGASGWRIAFSFGVLICEVYDGTGASIVTGPGPAGFNPDMCKGHLLALALRARQVGGVLSVECWLGPCRVSVDSGAAGMTPSVAGQLSVGANAVFSDALNGAVFGVGYYEGTVTDDELRQAMGACIVQGEPPQMSTVPYDLLYSGWSLAQGSPAGAVWTPTIGASTLNRQGAASGVRGLFPAL